MQFTEFVWACMQFHEVLSVCLSSSQKLCSACLLEHSVSPSVSLKSLLQTGTQTCTRAWQYDKALLLWAQRIKMILLLCCPCFINQPSNLCQVLDPPQPSFIFLLLGNNFPFVVDKISSTILHNLYILAYLGLIKVGWWVEPVHC